MPLYKTEKKSKDGRQQYRVCVNYTDSRGAYRQKTKLVYGSNEAKITEMTLQNEVRTKDTVQRLTVQQLFEEYIRHKKNEVRTTTVEKSKSILEREVLPKLGGISLEKLNLPVLQSWKSEIADRKLSVTSKKNIYGEFRTMLNYAVKMEYIPRNPLNLIGNFKEVYFEKPQDKLHYYTPEQFKLYIAQACKDCRSLNDWGFYVFFNIAFYTGMRKGEINALKWSDIEGNVIHVRRSVAQKIKGKKIVETPPKNKTSYRDVQIPSVLIQILKEHKDRHKTAKGFSEDFRVCGGPSCLSDTAISNKNISFATQAGLPVIRIHDFRHSHASLLVNHGINIQEVARRLGHSKVEITWNTYSHLYPKEEDRALEVLESLNKT